MTKMMIFASSDVGGPTQSSKDRAQFQPATFAKVTQLDILPDVRQNSKTSSSLNLNTKQSHADKIQNQSKYWQTAKFFKHLQPSWIGFKSIQGSQSSKQYVCLEI